MRSTRRWSLAARLAAWYAVTAFLLVAAAAFIQYRTLVTSLSEEDDQLLAERLDAARSNPIVESQSKQGARDVTIHSRLLDNGCREIRPTQANMPPPACTDAGGTDAAQYRNWRSPEGQLWRIASARLSGTRPGRIEILLDRSKDELVLREYREELGLVLGAALIASGLIGYAIARHGLRPLAVLRQRMTRVDARSLDQRLGSYRAPAEIEELVSSFDAMLDRLEGAFKALSELSAELAHELRTPLHVLRQQSEVALRRARSPQEYRDLLESSLEELDRLGRMADDMLFLARTEDPRSKIDRQSLAITAELEQVSQYLDALAAEARVTLEVDAPPSLRVVADRMLLRRALVNVVTNSLRHAPPGGRVRLTARTEGTTVVASVEDNGAGIPPESLPRVFDRYFRAPTANASLEHGSGLGLAIVRGIMQLHGGTATIVSTPGGKTVVSLAFPQAQTASV